MHAQSFQVPARLLEEGCVLLGLVFGVSRYSVDCRCSIGGLFFPFAMYNMICHVTGLFFPDMVLVG